MKTQPRSSFTPLVVMLALLAPQLSGCLAGYNSVLFATKSNAGLDFDTAPPTMDVAVSRKEGTIAPVFEGGQTLPMMSSFKADHRVVGRFLFGVGSTFSVGDAAYLMAHLYDSPTVEGDSECIPKILISEVPRLPFESEERESRVGFVEPGKVRPVLFGTDSALGATVQWTGATAQVPSSFRAGFSRKEFALAPIGLTPAPDCPADADGEPTKYHVNVPSLLATLDTNVEAEATAAGGKYVQYFATGTAATELAKHRAVREAMLKRLDPEMRIGALSESSMFLLNWERVESNRGKQANFKKQVEDHLKTTGIDATYRSFLLEDKHEDAREDFIRESVPVYKASSAAGQEIIERLRKIANDADASMALGSQIDAWLTSKQLTVNRMRFLRDPANAELHKELLKHLDAIGS